MSYPLSKAAAFLLVDDVKEGLFKQSRELAARIFRDKENKGQDTYPSARIFIKLALALYEPKQLGRGDMNLVGKLPRTIIDPAIRILVLTSVTNALPKAALDALNAYSPELYRSTLLEWDDDHLDLSEFFFKSGRPNQD